MLASRGKGLIVGFWRWCYFGGEMTDKKGIEIGKKVQQAVQAGAVSFARRELVG